MVLIGQFYSKHNAVQEFEKIFGSWYTIGVDIAEGVDENFNGSKLLLSPDMAKQLVSWAQDANGPFFNWHSHIHVNFS